MTADTARKWIIFSSLAIIGAQILFLLIAPSIGYPLQYPKNLSILQIVTPVFLGYLGSATHFVFKASPPTVVVNEQFLGPLVKGPILIYAAAMIAAFATFSYTNRPGAPIGSGMSTDDLATAISIALGLLAVTTGVLTAYLFTGRAPERPGPVG
jgi:hypothetical protein